ncbi:Hypothetical protein LEPBI_I1060 [Leptospira biflexa serovar Patoc strain 'Patoc 1 (Paris)']|uniref:Uncharacterized protein n=1 Tax=Leptospira biflexa serovar Patoc (strain Patoc 1 / ATCC 23582 / Paris) TaxID=456481 RepID=B0SMZ6_LEPBP|nr:Hypothetical protein LEPBI_I1060 [Leptospira biflexa serovar Patoc strain 'Patoc 1 (Paris)']
MLGYFAKSERLRQADFLGIITYLGSAQFEYRAPTQVPQISESALADLATATLIFFRSNVWDDFSILCLDGSKPQGKVITPPFSTWMWASVTVSNRMSVYKFCPFD